MSSKKEAVFAQLKRAAERLEEVLKLPRNDVIRDSAIQRFEFTSELAWKTLKEILEEKGQKIYPPADILKASFKAGIIDEDEAWMEMVKARNLTSHLYKESLAEEIYGRLPVFLEKIKSLIKKISS